MNWNYLWILVGVVVVAYVALFLAEWVRPQEPERPTPVLDPGGQRSCRSFVRSLAGTQR
jgi:hypothetical protein